MNYDLRFTQNLLRFLLLSLLTTSARTAWADEPSAAGYADPPMPAFRVQTDGFDASAADIKAICSSAGRELWRYFPDYQIELFVIQRSRSGPIVAFKRNEQGEISVRLDTHGTFWSQYAYQFAHEFCHVLCGFDEDYAGNKWFEETICETASLFVMRAMARAWADDPPYANWKDYRHSLEKYADDVIAGRQEVLEIYENGLGQFYLAHREQLTKSSGLRDLNGAMSLVFLRLFEDDPRRWEAVRWLNHEPSPPGETFSEYLQKWHDVVPTRHRPFVTTVTRLYGIAIETSGDADALAISQQPHRLTAPNGYTTPPMPKYRIDDNGFEASARDIQAVCDSAGRELWRFFPAARIEPFVVVRGHDGPRVLYQRNSQGEIVVKLDTHGTLWSQYAFQFSYLFAKILVGFDKRSEGNIWFETTVCEAAQLFALRAMSRAWEHDPPYANWKEYRHSLAKYALDITDGRQQLAEQDVAEYYREHQTQLAGNTAARDITGALAVVLLRVLEEHPSRLEAIQWLNQSPSPKDEPLAQYLSRWHAAVPANHRAFVERIAELFGEEIESK